MQYRRPTRPSSLRSAGRRGVRRWTGRARRRGVSEVVATIILLALTVVLFASIFAWVTNFPVPSQPNSTQFSANLVLTANLSYVKAIQITHLAGPPVSGNALVYLKSAYHPSAPEFQNPIVAGTALPNPTTWNLGQTFNYTFPCPVGGCQQPKLPDNITVLLVVSTQVIFSTILPGTVVQVPPNFIATGISPANPAVAAGFTITAVVTGNTNNNPVYVNLANIPGLSGYYPVAQQMTYSAATGRWTFTVPATYTTTNGTFYAFVNVTNNVGQSATAGVVVTISPSSGGNSGNGLNVAVVMVPQPPTLPTASSYFAAIVTYSGSGTNLALSVEFFVNQTVGTNGPTAFPASKTTLAAPSGLEISGPSTLTVYSSSPSTFSAWLLNSSVAISATGSVATVGSASGTTTFTTANLVMGVAGVSATVSHTCTAASTCPYLTATVSNAWLTSLSPAGTSITFSGEMYANQTGHASFSSAIASTALASGAAVTSSGAVDTAARWKPAVAGAYTIVLVLTIKLTSSGQVIGYVWATTSGTST